MTFYIQWHVANYRILLGSYGSAIMLFHVWCNADLRDIPILFNHTKLWFVFGRSEAACILAFEGNDCLHPSFPSEERSGKWMLFDTDLSTKHGVVRRPLALRRPYNGKILNLTLPTRISNEGLRSRNHVQFQESDALSWCFGAILWFLDSLNRYCMQRGLKLFPESRWGKVKIISTYILTYAHFTWLRDEIGSRISRNRPILVKKSITEVVKG